MNRVRLLANDAYRRCLALCVHGDDRGLCVIDGWGLEWADDVDADGRRHLLQLGGDDDPVFVHALG